MGQYLNDHVTLEDDLGRLQLLKDVIEQVKDADLPRVIGVHGDWGSGKSSFLLQIEGVLTNFSQRAGESQADDEYLKSAPKELIDLADNTHPVVWFEAWRYQHDSQPVVTLLQEIRKQLSPARRGLNSFKKLGTVGVEMILTGLSGITEQVGLVTDPKKIRESGERYEALRYEVPSSTVTISQLLDHSIKELLKNFDIDPEPNRLVVLIDDLDRCDADMAQKLLEGLKVFLPLENCVFVLAMDETVVEEFITKKIKSDGTIPAGTNPDVEAKRRARQYLEKICQGHFRLPFATKPEELFIKCLRELPVESQIVDSFDEYIEYEHVVPPNPRKIKLLANAMVRFCKGVKHENLFGHGDDKSEEEQSRARRADSQMHLAYLLAYSYQFEPRVYRLIERYKSEFINTVLMPFAGYGSGVVPKAYEDLLVVPRELADGDTDQFPDPILSGVFYPLLLMEHIKEVDDSMVVELLNG